MSTLISRQEAKARGRATTAASEQLRRMLEDSLRLDDAVERLERLEQRRTCFFARSTMRSGGGRFPFR